MTADELDRLNRKITREVFEKHGVALTAISVYSYNTKDPEAAEMRRRVSKIVTADPYVREMHGFYVDKKEKRMRFDIVVSFDAADRKKVYREVCEKVQKEFPDYRLLIALDADFSEEGISE